MLSAAAAVTLAFALRVYLLGGQSLWSDEGNSFAMTGRGFAAILEAAAADIHPPLYYLLLRLWSPLAGTSEFSLRFLSLFFGVLLVAVTYALGRRLLGRGAALAGAALAAASPLLVYYSQEARMYALLALLSALSAYLCVVALSRGEEPKGASWAGLVWPFAALAIANAALLYTQYFGLATVAFENAAFVALLLTRRRWRTIAPWAASQMATLLLFLPWLLKASGQLSAWPATGEPFTLIQLAARVFAALTLGQFAASGLSWPLALAVGLGILGFAWACFPRVSPQGLGGRSRWAGLVGAAYLLGYLAATPAMLYLLSLSRPAYNPKFVLPAAVPLYLLVGAGVVALSRGIALLVGRRAGLGRAMGLAMAAAALSAVMLAGGQQLVDYYHDPILARDDYRAIVRYIGALSRPGDAAILNAPGQQEVFAYYNRGQTAVYPLPESRPLDRSATVERLRQMASEHRRLWLVLWGDRESDPEGVVQQWLGENGYRASHRWFGNVQLLLYATEPLAAQSRSEQGNVSGVSFSEIELEDGSFEGNGEGKEGGDLAAVEAGDVLRAALLWQATGPVRGDYTVFLHLLDEQGNVWAQSDTPPVGGRVPTSQWLPGQEQRDYRGLFIPPGTPPGLYSLELGLYEAATGKRLPRNHKAAGDSLVLGPVRVLPPERYPRPEELSPQFAFQADFGALHLGGYELVRLSPTEKGAAYKRGEGLRLTLLWQAKEAPKSDYKVVVRLTDRAGKVALEQRGDPAAGRYPTSRWRAGELVRDPHTVLLDLAPGRYQLVVGIEETGAPAKVERLWEIEVE